MVVQIRTSQQQQAKMTEIGQQQQKVEANILVLGAENVGKSALTVRFLTRRFIGEYVGTESVYTHNIMVDGRETLFSIWDSVCPQNPNLSDVRQRRAVAMGRWLHPGLQHLRPRQLQRGTPAAAARPPAEEAPELGPRHHRGQQTGPPAPAGGLQRRRAPPGHQLRLRLLRDLGGGDLPRLAGGLPPASGVRTGEPQRQQEKRRHQRHRQEYVRRVRAQEDRV
ncbi:unnamed protein product, partial [Staurois parvus]